MPLESINESIFENVQGWRKEIGRKLAQILYKLESNIGRIMPRQNYSNKHCLLLLIKLSKV